TALSTALISDKWAPFPQQFIEFFTDAFKDFPALQERIKSCQNKDFITYILQNPNSLHTTTGNPLEVAFLLNDRDIVRSCFKLLGEKDFFEKLLHLQKKYLQSSTDMIEFCMFDVDLAHLQKTIRSAIPNKPVGVEVSDLLNIFKNNPIEELPEIGIKSKRELEEILTKELIDKIKNRLAYTGTPIEANQREHFYQTIENAICHTIPKLTSSTTRETLKVYLKAAKYCGTRIRDSAIERYETIVIGRPPTFDLAIYQILAEFRKMLLEYMVPSGDQNVHDATQYFYLLADELNLPNKDVKIADPLAKKVDKNTLKAAFMKLYNPVDIIANCIHTNLQNDGSLKESCIDYLKGCMPQDFKPELSQEERGVEYLNEVLDSDGLIKKSTIASIILIKLGVLTKSL
ncbi:MAG: hypothetical protein JWO53_1239, partial [Chlamydiia bacterium]|nr:hypothetical protein [Chlamydiia bacterium]